ncbi:MAG: D-alanyl-D-alanine carboxypeptidase family protein [Caldicoprobacterales bacterium]|jgi:D-alanyl-D-alanine carboxypeptidase (penicillin-binding protein 5/6)|nr:D-alanyl-D-alanine carboxypeptidase [Clostridiales bacterium]
MRKYIGTCITLILIILFVLSNINVALATQPPFDIQAKSAILMDYETGTILYEKNPQEKLPVASLAKIMTILLALEAVDEEKISLEETVQISEHASSMGGSQVFLHAGETLTVEALLKAIVVASGNDASVAIAEKIGGTHEAFVARMNERAKELGMMNTHFVNATGLPAENNYSTAYDVALMSRELLNHPLFFRWSTIWVDTLEESRNKTELTNTNRLIRFYDGADGLKTGSTQEAGYCLSATAKRGNMRLLSIVLGAPSSKIRFSESSKMMDFGFANYEVVSVLKKDQVVKDNVYVSGGKEEFIDGVVSQNVSFLIKTGESRDFDKEVLLEEKIEAPLKKGDKIGTLTITQGDKVVQNLDIVSDRDVLRANVFDYFKKIFSNWIRK